MKLSKKGFTLVEIIVVLVIMGILLAIAVPSVLGYVQKAEEQKFKAITRNAFLTSDLYIKENLTGSEKKGDELVEEYQKFAAKLTEDAFSGEFKIFDKDENSYDGYQLKDVVIYFDTYGDIITTPPLGGPSMTINKDLNSHAITKVGFIYQKDTANTKYVVYRPNEGIQIFKGTEGFYEMYSFENGKWGVNYVGR